MKERELEQKVYQMIKRSVIYLSRDVKKAIFKAYQNEKSKLGRLQLKNIIDNIRIAEKKKIPICQDTGVPIFFVKVGKKAKLPLNFETILKRAVKRACKEVPLRPNVGQSNR